MPRNDWFKHCKTCGFKAGSVSMYGLHMKECPTKCGRCKEWFSDVYLYIAHPCKQVAHAESGN